MAGVRIAGSVNTGPAAVDSRLKRPNYTPGAGRPGPGGGLPQGSPKLTGAPAGWDLNTKALIALTLAELLAVGAIRVRLKRYHGG